jgi:hypothetical protein
MFYLARFQIRKNPVEIVIHAGGVSFADIMNLLNNVLMK